MSAYFNSALTRAFFAVPQRMNRPIIRHLAIFVRDVDKVAEFYQSVFQMK